jgi:hypothetical protein
MTDVVVEPQAVIASPASTFPQEIEVTFTLKLTVNGQLERDFWFEPGTTDVTLDAIADTFDMLSDGISPVNSINGYTYAQLQQAMSERDI